jgi:AhpD family alkylhydroperoxidase
MPLVELIDSSSCPLPLRHLFADGDPGPIAAALAQVPELCGAALPFVGAALGPGWLPARLKELAILRTSALARCRYCVDAHTVVALDLGLARDEVCALRDEADPATVFADPVERAALAWIDAVAGERGAPPDEVGEELRRHLPDHAVVELTVTIGATLFLNRFATALGLPTSPETLTRLAREGLT